MASMRPPKLLEAVNKFLNYYLYNFHIIRVDSLQWYMLGSSHFSSSHLLSHFKIKGAWLDRRVHNYALVHNFLL